ncbi:MAG: translation elongation factor 4, partial [Phycisphaerales bacterium JB050]
TIKLHAVRMAYRAADGVEYELNLIDTPGHVDFTYEVSRSLQACEGALLVVDASQGVEAQTLANTYLALDAGLEIIPCLNKIDLPGAEPERVGGEVAELLGEDADAILRISGKTGEGVNAVLNQLVQTVPPPGGDRDAPARALIFDSEFDQYRGVIAYIRVVDGVFKKGDKIAAMAAGTEAEVDEIGIFSPQMHPIDELGPGEVGYVITGIKDVLLLRVGDTLTHRPGVRGGGEKLVPAEEPLPGYREIKPMVFCGLFPTDTAQYPDMRDALEKLSLNDAALVWEPETSDALGFGFRIGFLGLLHMDIIQERLEREGGVEVVQTAPNVTYELLKRDKELVEISNPADLPDPSLWLELREPIVRVELMINTESVGDIMSLCLSRRGIFKSQQAVSETRQFMTWEMPLAEIIYDFYDKLKSMTRGYATMDYEIIGFRKENLSKVDILINGDIVEALSFISHRDTADKRGRSLLTKLKKQIDRHQFEIPLQAVIGGKIIARESIKGVRKNVTAKCYGGDVSRKRKLLEKQKKGKKKMKSIGSVNIPQEAFMAVLDTSD